MTGGEACIQSAAASAIGIASDIGGSIRIPAFCNGVFGHKATTGLYVCLHFSVVACLLSPMTLCDCVHITCIPTIRKKCHCLSNHCMAVLDRI